ncbi:MAG: twin-arginine translocase TatA/TatE family subunit [Elusimicrobia bacterium]|nr:twin-arginine translocase TatA/TatE family subunit [Elusimicrobiota bacterium]
MRTLFFSFLVLVMALTIYGSQAEKLIRVTKEVLSLKKEFKAMMNNFNSNQEGPAVIDQNQLQELLKKQAAARNEDEKQFDPEVQRMLKEINKENIVVINPIMQKMLASGSPSTLQQLKEFDLKNYIAQGITNLERLNEKAGKYFCLSAMLVFLLMLITRFNSFSSIGYLCANTGFIISRSIIFLAAIIAVVAHFSLKFNVLTNLDSIFLWGPLTLMIISALALKIYDFNNPVWNKMFFSVMWPIASGVFIHLR